MGELISVIVPIYKVEDYLDRCIKSIVEQTYSNLEIILVDDGSPDQCPKLCDEWATKDQRIKVIHKKNGGLSDARNAGMKVMTGDYISYIDSDDWIAKDMYERMLEYIKKEQADICECDFVRTSRKVKNTSKKQDEQIISLDKEKALQAVVEEKIQPVVWNKLYRKEIVNTLCFEVGKYNEDEFFTYKAIEKADKIVKISYVGYYYFFREDSIINEAYTIRRLDGLDARYERMKYLKKYPKIYGIAKRQLVFNCMYHYQKGLQFLSGKELKELKKKVKRIYYDIPIVKEDIQLYSMKEKIWFYLSKISLEMTCKIRNSFKYGV